MVREGKCKYCGQIAMIDCPEGFTQEEVDEEASKKMLMSGSSSNVNKRV